MSEALSYPRIWKNKKTGKKFPIVPWWETVKDGEIDKVDELGQLIAEVAGRPCKFGVIVQVGFLLENEYGVFLGVGPMAAKEFEDLGEWKKPKRKKR